MRIVAKVGGAQIEEAHGRDDLARSVASAREAGHEIVLVHGGGNQIRGLTKRLQITDRYHDGLRITDPETAEVVLMVLAGLVNKQVVWALEQAGVTACGVSGADGSTFLARPMLAKGVDLGYVGEVLSTSRALVETLLTRGFVPVVATVAPLDPAATGNREHFYNLNADLCAGPLAQAFRAEAMLFLTDVPGVLDADKRLIGSLTAVDCAELRSRGVIHGGMIPKVDAAVHAAEKNPAAIVKIAPAKGRDAIREALADTVGTRFHC